MSQARTQLTSVASLAVGILAASLPTQAAAPGRQQPFRAGVDLVRVPVVVRARSGALVHGLTAADFDVREDGRTQTVTVCIEGDGGGAVPLHVGLVVDASESMGADLRTAEDAAARFVDDLERVADVTLVDFDADIRVARFEPDSFTSLFTRLRAPQPAGLTALYDAIGTYLGRAAGEAGEKVLLVYSDGGDTVSQLDFGRLEKLLEMSDVTVYTVGYLDHESGSARMVQQVRMRAIAAATGGDAFFPGSSRQVADAYARILDEVRGHYELGYVSSNAAHDGTWRKVEIRTGPAAGDARLRTRGGYYAPGPAAGRRR